MLERATDLFGGRIEDTLKVVVPNGVVLAAVNTLEVKAWLEILLVSLSILYTLWRWRRESYAACEGCRVGRIPRICPLPTNRRPWWCPKKV